MAESKSEYGREVLTQMIGPEKASIVAEAAKADRFGSALLSTMMEFCFADTWGRPGLSRRERSLVTMAVLIAREAKSELASHIEIALGHGVTPAEIEEVILQTMPYTGLPPANGATTVAAETLKRLGHMTEGGLPY